MSLEPCIRRRCHLAQCFTAQSAQGIMITHRLGSLHILIHDEYRSTEKLSTGLRNTRLLVRPQLVSTAPVLWWVLGARRGGAAGSSLHVRSPAHGGISHDVPGFRRRSRVISDGTQGVRDDASRASRAHIWHVGGVAVLVCRARCKSHITRHINTIALWRHNPHINA